MVCHSEFSVVDREANLTVANVLFSLFVRLLSLRLSERYFVLCQVEQAFRFSEIRTLTCKGRFLT